MTAQIACYFALSYLDQGRHEVLGSIQNPVAEVSSPGTGKLVRTVTVPAGGTLTKLWEYLDQLDFEVLALRIPGTGYLRLAIKIDTPTSASDLTPSGGDIRWRELEMTCKIPFILNTDQALVASTAADDYADDAGEPKILKSATTVEEAKVYEIVGRNDDADNDVEVEVWVLN